MVVINLWGLDNYEIKHTGIWTNVQEKIGTNSCIDAGDTGISSVRS